MRAHLGPRISASTPCSAGAERKEIPIPYYARVLEIPTPRWVVYDAFRYGIEIPEGAKTTHQERAYTAPIWYTP